MPKGLYVEDDMNLSKTIIESLSEKGVQVDWVRSVKDAVMKIKESSYSFFILDIGLLDGEGYEIAQYLKDHKIEAPIIFLTARNSAEDRLKGYELGAVEYIPKPFLFAELWLRLDHVLKDHIKEEVIDLGDLKVNRDSYSFSWLEGETIFLSEKEFQVFILLYEQSPKVVRRSDILDQIWGEDAYPSERTVDNIILKIRQHLKHHSSYLKSIRGVGYLWEGK